MKRAFILLLVLAIALPSFSTPPQKDGEKELSPFAGIWNWAWNDNAHRFYIWCGERNDSLLFAIGGTFFYGDRIHMPEWDKNEKFIQMMRIKKPHGNMARSKMYEIMSNFYCGDEKKLNDVTFELLCDTAMLFILDDNKAYWPDTALMILREKKNIEFSQQEHEHIYKEK
ncbi:MAG: hypothetical protein IKY19_09510 [Bacteroidaceae bacterium]|nr:hypothetical protein [Bacteroidaceae bacterium]